MNSELPQIFCVFAAFWQAKARRSIRPALLLWSSFSLRWRPSELRPAQRGFMSPFLLGRPIGASSSPERVLGQPDAQPYG